MDAQHLACVVWEWADSTFPHRTDVSMFLKLYSEIGELVENPNDEEEIADIFIMLFDFAVRKGINIESAVMKKLAVNKQREWYQTPTGVMRHIK